MHMKTVAEKDTGATYLELLGCQMAVTASITFKFGDQSGIIQSVFAKLVPLFWRNVYKSRIIRISFVRSGLEINRIAQSLELGQ